MFLRMQWNIFNIENKAGTFRNIVFAFFSLSIDIIVKGFARCVGSLSQLNYGVTLYFIGPL